MAQCHISGSPDCMGKRYRDIYISRTKLSGLVGHRVKSDNNNDLKMILQLKEDAIYLDKNIHKVL